MTVVLQYDIYCYFGLSKNVKLSGGNGDRERERELQASSLSRMLKTGLKNIAADVEVDQSKINQIGDASVVFGELFFGSWLLAAMCTLMEPCLWSGCIWCVGEREECRDAGHVLSHRRRSLEFSGRGSLGELLHVRILSLL